VGAQRPVGLGATRRMSLPRLLIIGAMKAGTTSLYMDLAGHSQAFLGDDKEPHSLCRDDVLTPEGRAKYESVYAKAEPGQLCIDASTGYSKRPDFEGVAQRALRVLPEGFKVVYVVRHPIERIISQHHHEHAAREAGPSIDEEVRRHARYVQYSRYSYQLDPWIAAVGRERIQVVRFEDYVDFRQETVRQLCSFIGLAPEACLIEEQRVYNKSQGKPVKPRFWNAVQHNQTYRRFLRPLAPVKLRLAIRQALFPKATDRPAPPSEETLAHLRDALSEDVQRLEAWLGRSTPLWSDFAAGDGSPVAAARHS
jgi:hypothetical protein